MCDYDVKFCKILVYAVAIIFSYFFLEFMIIKVPEIQQCTEENLRYEKELRDVEKLKDLERMKELFSNINVNDNVNGYMSNRVQISGHLFKTEL